VITCSSDLGRIGLLERENAGLLNAALTDLARDTIAAFEVAIASSGIAAPLFITQNDGTVAEAEQARRLPVTASRPAPPIPCAAGPTSRASTRQW